VFGPNCFQQRGDRLSSEDAAFGGVGLRHGFRLVVKRRNAYLRGERDWCASYSVKAVTLAGYWGADHRYGFRLTQHSNVDNQHVVPKFEDGDEFGFVFWNREFRRYVCDIGNRATWPQVAGPPPVIAQPGLAAATQHAVWGNELGDRVVGALVRSVEPVFCGPLSPYGYVPTLRPIDSGSVMLPPRLNNFRLKMSLVEGTLTNSAGSMFDCVLDSESTEQLICEYLPFDGHDEVEKSTMYCPLFVKKSFSSVGIQKKCDMTFINGPPTFFYIRHDPVKLKKFRIAFRDKKSHILERALPEDHFKMMNRSVHPQCSLTYSDWAQGTRGFLVRLEELGIFAPALREWQDRCQLSFEIIELDDETVSEIDLTIYGVYEHYALRDRHDLSDFVFM